MKQKSFEKAYNKEWTMLRILLDDSKTSKVKTDHAKFPALYRKVCNHLALARERNYSLSLVNTLEDLVLQGHQHFYGSRSPMKFRLVEYFAAGFPQAIRRESKLVWTSILLLFGPALLLTIVIQIYPHVAYMLLSNETLVGLEEMYNPAAERFGEQRGIDSDFMMWAFYVNNNVSLDFKCFAWGIFLGLGSAFFLLFNGIFFGTIAGHLCNLGFGVTLWPFVIGHGSLELIAAAFAGASGMLMGFSLINTGRLTRLESLKDGAAKAAYILYGTAFMTFLAAFVEAYWSSRVDISNTIKYTVGACGWVIVISYFVFAGRRKVDAV
jgi:uncharacterized membrane protein SpoIIM required for sporulation